MPQVCVESAICLQVQAEAVLPLHKILRHFLDRLNVLLDRAEFQGRSLHLAAELTPLGPVPAMAKGWSPVFLYWVRHCLGPSGRCQRGVVVPTVQWRDWPVAEVSPWFCHEDGGNKSLSIAARLHGVTSQNIRLNATNQRASVGFETSPAFRRSLLLPSSGLKCNTSKQPVGSMLGLASRVTCALWRRC